MRNTENHEMSYHKWSSEIQSVDTRIDFLAAFGAQQSNSALWTDLVFETQLKPPKHARFSIMGLRNRSKSNEFVAQQVKKSKLWLKITKKWANQIF